MQVTQFVHEGLGNSSYLVQLTANEAVLVDPDRSAERYTREATQRGLRITGVLETHVHADFATGAREIAERHGAKVYASAAGGLQFPHQALRPGDSLVLDGTEVRVIGSAGHTPEHLSYVLRAPREGAPALFSGGSLIIGGAARTDLISRDRTEELTRAQFRTLRSAFSGLPDETLLYPTHGGGSFCAAGAGSERSSTLGEERRTNPLLSMEDEDEFTRWFPATFTGAPDYFFRMRALNQRGPALRREVAGPVGLSPEDFNGMTCNALVVDARPAEEYRAGHIPGSLSIAFRPSFATWLGWLVPEGTPVLFVTDREVLDEVVEESLLVGYETFAGYLEGGIEAWSGAGMPLRRTRSAQAHEARHMLRAGALALDVRESDEFGAGHVNGAVHAPLGTLPRRIASLPGDQRIVAYCGHGERSATALSLLERAGFTNIVDLAGGYGAFAAAVSALMQPQ